MKILAPLTKKEEVSIMSDADQFYCGLIAQSKLNDRPNDGTFNFTNVEDLEMATKEVIEKGKEIFLTINQMTTDIDASVEQAKMAERIGMTGVITANMLLLKRLSEMELDLQIYASCLNGTFNSEALSFMKKFGIKGIHLPRHLGIDEVATLKKNHPDLHLSVFGMEGLCVNIEAFCFLHSLKEEHFEPCDHFFTEYIRGDLEGIDTGLIDKRIKAPDYSCGLCAFKKLKDADISIIKIEGRGLSTEKKLRRLKAVKAAMDNIEDQDFQKNCKKIFKENLGKECKEEYCYF